MTELQPHQIGIVEEIVKDIKSTITREFRNSSQIYTVLALLKKKLHAEVNSLFWQAIPEVVTKVTFGNNNEFIIDRPNTPYIAESDHVIWDEKDIQATIQNLKRHRRRT